MAVIEYSTSLHEDGLVLSRNDAHALLPLLFRAQRRQMKFVEHYQDIHESGSACKFHETLLMKHEEKAQRYGALIKEIQSFLTQHNNY